MADLVIGHTTDSTARIWVRGDARHRDAIVTVSSSSPLRRRVHLSRDTDYTATVDFDGLDAHTGYTVAALFPSGSSVATARGAFKTLPGPSSDGPPSSFSFVLSSCNLPVVSVNNLFAYLLAVGGTMMASSSLDLPRERWTFPFRWLRAILRPVFKLLLQGVALFVKTATRVKQPGRPYLRSPFLKLSAVFDPLLVTFSRVETTPLPTAGAVVRTGQARGVVACTAVPKKDEARPTCYQTVLAQVEGTFEPEEALWSESGAQIGIIESVARGRPWYRPPCFFIHTGDQIYYDFPFEDRRPDRNAYRLDYREAWFDDEGARHLFSHWPHYMTLDDHEIADQFALDFTPPGRDSAATYRVEATAAYRQYVHARHPADPNRRAAGPYWYAFDTGAARFFVLDTRTERANERPLGPRLIDDAQMEALLAWMTCHKDDLKFVVTSVPFVAEVPVEAPHAPDWFQPGAEPAPDEADRSPRNPPDDTWSARRFEGQRSRIIDHIHEHGIEHLVFLTGDMHCCYHATLQIGEGSKYECLTVHELAGGPINQLQMATIDSFSTRHAGRTTGDTPYEIALDRFHGQVNAVLHLAVDYVASEGVVGSSPAWVPEVTWTVIRTMTNSRASDWTKAPDAEALDEQQSTPSPLPGEPTMTGRIRFVRKRTVDGLRRWPRAPHEPAPAIP